MQFRSDAKAVASLGLLLAGSLMLLTSNPAAAQQSSGSGSIEARVCPPAGSSSLTVTLPASDSVTDEPEVTIEGTVEYISQVDFFIDDTYNHTVALGYATTAFRSSLMLPPGTHTIRIVAIDSCSQTTHTESVIMTYTPKAQPSVGSDTDTSVPSLDKADSSIGQRIQRSFLNIPRDLFSPSILLPREAIRPVPHTHSAPSSDVDNGLILGDSLLDASVRAGMVTAGVVLLAAPTMIASSMQLLAGKITALHGIQALIPNMGRPHFRLRARVVGGVLVLLAFLL